MEAIHTSEMSVHCNPEDHIVHCFFSAGITTTLLSAFTCTIKMKKVIVGGWLGNLTIIYNIVCVGS
jgi:hypothetical protein